MAFDFSCPNCQQSLEAEEEWRGMEIDCPSCGAELTVPTKEKVKPKKKLSISKPSGAGRPSGGGGGTKRKKPEKPLGKKLAVWSMVFGIFSMCPPLMLLFSLPGLIMSAVAMSRASKKVSGGAGFAIAGLVLNILGLVGLIIMLGFGALLLPALSKAREKARMVTSLRNMQQINSCLIQYAQKHGATIPPGNNATGLNHLLGEYISDPQVFDDPNAETPAPLRGEKLTDANCDYGYFGGQSGLRANPKMPVLWEKHPIDEKRRVMLMNGEIQSVSVLAFNPETFFQRPTPLGSVPAKQQAISSSPTRSVPAPQPRAKQTVSSSEPKPVATKPTVSPKPTPSNDGLAPRKPLPTLKFNAKATKMKAIMDKYLVHGVVWGKYETDFVKGVPRELMSGLSRSNKAPRTGGSRISRNKQYPYLYPEYDKDEIPRIFIKGKLIYYPIYGSWKWKVGSKWITFDENMNAIEGEKETYPHWETRISYFIVPFEEEIK